MDLGDVSGVNLCTRMEAVMSTVSAKSIEDKIYVIRGQKVMLDSDLAELYGVDVKRLNEQVKRNLKRFPIDFMFQMTVDERDLLRSQIATFEETVFSLRMGSLCCQVF